MVRVFITVLALIVAVQVFAEASIYQQIEEEFQHSVAPQEKKTLGVWAGHCVQAHDQNQKWPAVYINKALLDPQTNIETLTQTYFWEKKNDPNYFKGFVSAKYLNQYSPLQEWLKREQWNPTQVLSDSLQNQFNLSNGGVVTRSLRVNETEFSKMLLLKVERKQNNANETLSYCAFSKYLGASMDESNPSPDTFLIHTGQIGNTSAEIRLPAYKRPMAYLVIRKKSWETPILSNIVIYFENGQRLDYPLVQFGADGQLALEVGKYTQARATSVRFDISGWATDLEFYSLAQ